jgi:hypothetical protein
MRGTAERVAEVLTHVERKTLLIFSKACGDAAP